MEKYHVIGFRPTKEMYDLIESVKKETGLTDSQVMRTIMSEYIRFVRKYNKNYK